jgi:cytochrome c oxidase subunit II
MPTPSPSPLPRLALPILVTSVLAVGAWAFSGSLGAESTIREVSVTARKYAFEPPVITVRQDDIVRVTFRADDIAHSFTMDAYRISKRVNGGQTVTFEFRADRAGTFPIYCALQADEGCRRMQASLVVQPR